MAIAVNGGHVSRALDFYDTEGKYFIIGGETPWEKEDAPPTPNPGDFRLVDVIGLKKVDNIYLVIPTEETENVISYRDQNWKRVSKITQTTIGSAGVPQGNNTIPLTSIEGFTVGDRVRVANIYEGKIVSISGLLITLDSNAPIAIPAGSSVVGGAMVEGAKYVYVECSINNAQFPTNVSYRQIGLCTGVTPNNSDILLSAAHSATSRDEYSSLGTLEILDNRVSYHRDEEQSEHLSLIIEF